MAEDKRKLPLLLTVLALCVGLVAWDRWPSRSAAPAVIGAVERAHTQPLSSAAPQGQTTHRDASTGSGGQSIGAADMPDLLSREMFAKDGAHNNPFDKPAPAAPRPVAAPVEQPVQPSAPPLPFGLLGRKYEEGRWEIYLTKGDQTYIVHTNDVIDDTYKVVDIKPPAMTLLYLPTNERQSMQIGAPTND